MALLPPEPSARASARTRSSARDYITAAMTQAILIRFKIMTIISGAFSNWQPAPSASEPIPSALLKRIKACR